VTSQIESLLETVSVYKPRPDEKGDWKSNSAIK